MWVLVVISAASPIATAGGFALIVPVVVMTSLAATFAMVGRRNRHDVLFLH
jgi:hypothetical protein